MCQVEGVGWVDCVWGEKEKPAAQQGHISRPGEPKHGLGGGVACVRVGRGTGSKRGHFVTFLCLVALTSCPSLLLALDLGPSNNGPCGGCVGRAAWPPSTLSTPAHAAGAGPAATARPHPCLAACAPVAQAICLLLLPFASSFGCPPHPPGRVNLRRARPPRRERPRAGPRPPRTRPAPSRVAQGPAVNCAPGRTGGKGPLLASHACPPP